MIDSVDDFSLNNETCSLIDLTMDGTSIEETLPTLNAFVEYLRTFGRASHCNSSKMYYKFPNSIIAAVYFIPSQPLKKTMETMIASLEAPAPFHREQYNFSWDERESGKRLKLFPKATAPHRARYTRFDHLK